MVNNLQLSAPQHVFLNELTTKFRAYVGGFGSGKTYVGCLDLLLFALSHKGIIQGYFGPTYPSIRDIFYPTIEEAAESLGLRVVIKASDKEVSIYKGRHLIGIIICRSMDRPESIVGFKIARALVDEIDTMPLHKATAAWRKIIARMRLKIPGVINGIGVTCTPEGFLFVYDHFKKNPTKSYSMVQASTYENEEFLPDDYIEVLLESYPSNLVEAYINGDFVNLTSGTVYVYFDRHIHDTNSVVKFGEPIDIGMDFNVGKMSAVIFKKPKVDSKRSPHLEIVDEIIGYADTPALIEAIKEEFPHNKVTVFPDAAGKGRHTVGATLSDHKLLKDAGFTVRVLPSNPLVKDRVQSVNKLFSDGRLKINTAKCPETTAALEQQVYDKNGKPDKTMDLDHPLDALGYRISRDYLLSRPTINYGRAL